MILGNRKFVELPGERTHELPPLLVRMSSSVRRLDRVMDMASDLIEQEDILPPDPLGGDPAHDLDFQRRRMDLAVNLTEQYLGFVLHWRWGDDVLEWIRQCEMTFGTRSELRNLLRADLWPHANRSSFVTLLEDKAVETGGVTLAKAVGMRLTFRHPPPLKCFSDQFLLYLNTSIADTAYHTWAGMSEDGASALPPERFHFDVVNMSLQ
ncbi:MAG: hypothetical protein ABI811_14720 [Acidobacteriota bacterium]